ncbi:MAG: phosphomannomutase [Parcubacteria group bacterium]|nr:phosphomannomutase [Parcubacteria group bacterium]|tara:strand:+ start:2257 stop:3681 length:1425 start_codon:yes stop_codon:yes gene_type:complete
MGVSLTDLKIMAQLEKTMFREYDIRGLVNDEQVNEKSAGLIAKGFAKFLDKRGVKKIVIGYDSREYSKRLHDAFVQGLLSSGVDVTTVGMVISPVLYFAQYHLKFKGGAMITASHNPNGWGGFKLGYDFSTTLLPPDIKEMYEIILNDDFISGEGKMEEYKGINDDYEKLVTSRIKLKRKLKVVVNCGNGTAGEIAPRVLRAAGCEVVEQFCENDPTFPNHEPNPSLVSAQEALSEMVKKESADIGLGFDGDGDRVGFADENGETVLADQALILIARLALIEQPGSAIVFDVKATRGLIEDIKAHGGTPVMWKTGHSYIKAKSKEVDASLGGEGSGHIFYRHGYYDYDDAIFAALKLLEYLSTEDKTFSELMADTPQYEKTPTIQVDCADEIKYGIIDKLLADLKSDYGDKVVDINGARVELDNGWFLVRASSNMPVLTLGFEAKTEVGLKELQETLKKYLEKYPEIGKEWKSG